ncbi:alpha/beta hydrolase [Pseudenhygromyxa sp. WMMC2535]|uniref:alpha/beta hydrolase family protein n=1 Tax=Pseudenhygromyxa sp. WMMC2535 TaxID=2712867 RepID=UPI001557845E|nr:alpha/beta hydrolase [Pseudenhygromyxa sp. WMMC2535]NVB41168.1 alpha/beta hydrolase [Pseudenhygromyxa sp. WMMC2535]
MRATSLPLACALLLTPLACKPSADESVAPETAEAPAPEAAPVSPEGNWLGSLALPNNTGLDWILSVQPPEDAPEGPAIAQLWIPQQAVTGVSLGEPVPVPDQPGSYTVSWPQVNATWTLVPGEGPSCTFTQNGQALDCEVAAMSDEAFTEATALRRPQNPEGTPPYVVEELRFENPDAPGVTLAGTLTIPEGPGPHPAVVLLSGSGLQDRDETIFSHKPFWILADHLTRNGVAVLRYDDRGFGESTGDPKLASMEDFASDGWAAVSTLAARPEIDPKRIGLIGHSEGGVTGPLIAATHPKKIAFLVLLAGSGVRGDALLEAQAKLIFASQGMPAAKIEEQVAQSRAVHEVILATAGEDQATLEAKLRELLREQFSALPEGERPTDIDAAIDTQLEVLASPWYVHFIRWDPTKSLEKIKVPVLALNGELDLQVPPDQNIPAIEAALEHNRKLEVVRFPGLNHLFQPAETGAISEYAQIETTIAPEVLETITTWLTKVAKLDKPSKG